MRAPHTSPYWLYLCHTSSVRSTSDSRGPVTRKSSGQERARGTWSMTSAVGGHPLPESLSGPCRRLRYHEPNTHKVTKMWEPWTAAGERSSLGKCAGPILRRWCVSLLLQDLVQSCLRGMGGGYWRTCATRRSVHWSGYDTTTLDIEVDPQRCRFGSRKSDFALQSLVECRSLEPK